MCNVKVAHNYHFCKAIFSVVLLRVPLLPSWDTGIKYYSTGCISWHAETTVFWEKSIHNMLNGVRSVVLVRLRVKGRYTRFTFPNNRRRCDLTKDVIKPCFSHSALA